MEREEILELIEWHEAEASRLADRNIPNVNLDKHRRSASALRHLLQAQTWRKIEEAPKDSKAQILTLGPASSGNHSVVWAEQNGIKYWYQASWYSHDLGCWVGWSSREDSEFKPTHWMPLPQPPSTDEERASATPSEQQNEGEE